MNSAIYIKVSGLFTRICRYLAF